MLCYALDHKQLFFLTNRRHPPNAKQNTSGPARSVSSMMLASVCCNGFKTDRVCKIENEGKVRFNGY